MNCLFSTVLPKATALKLTEMLSLVSLPLTKGMSAAGRVDPHYLQILYLQIHLLTKISNPQINTCSTFVVIHGCAEWQKEKSELPNVPVPAKVEQGHVLPALFQLM